MTAPGAVATLYRLTDELPAKDRPEAIQAIRALAARVAELEAVLRWYAERRNYLPPIGSDHTDPTHRWLHKHDGFDGKGPGARARAALATDKEQQA